MTRKSASSRNQRTCSALIALFFVYAIGSHVFAQYVEDEETAYTGDDANETIAGLGIVDVISSLSTFGVQFPILGSGDFDGTLFVGTTANGILALSGEDIVVISDPLTATAEATATGVEFAGSLTGDASADVTVTASATTLAIDGGDDDDDIVAGNVITTNTTATATSASIALTLDSGLTNGADAGEALVMAGALAETDSTVIAAGAGDDEVTNNDRLIGIADATALTIAAGLAVDVGSGADVETGTALSSSSTIAISGITGVDGGAGADTINNNDLIDVSALSDATGVSVGLNIAGSVHGDAASGGALSQSETRAGSDATGIAGGSGDDTILDTAAIDVLAESTATAISANYSLTVSQTGDVTGGGGISDASTTATSNAIAIDGGEGADEITAITGGESGITTGATATATGIAATFTATGSVTGDAVGGEALSDARTDADAQTLGISGGGGSDTITSATRIVADSDATATAVAAGISVAVSKEGDVTAGAALSDASSLATASAIGIDGGADDDVIGGEMGITGAIELDAKASATGVAASITVAGSAKGDATSGDALSAARTDADAIATGISGGSGDDDITSASSIDAATLATATVVSEGFSVTISKDGDVSAGAAISDASSLASTRSTGIGGGAGDDTIFSTSRIDSIAGSDAVAVSDSFSVSVTVDGDATAGAAVSDTSSVARSAATGIDGGEGDDTIGEQENEIAGNITTLADATATGVSASFTVAGTAKGDAASGDALSEARTDADAAATGIAGGAGIDTITSAAGIEATSTSTATAVSAGVSVTISKDGDASSGGAVSDASSLALTNSTGIDGGDDDDTITAMTGSDLAIETVATSTATGVAATVTFAGTADGSTASGDALSAARTDADATATSISGGSGGDTITSDARIDAEATSKATAVAAGFSVTITGDGDATAGAAISDASSLARSAATGIDGGEGDDTIGEEENEIAGSITTLADATATGVSASFTVAGTAKGDAASGDALSEARTDADAVATGIAGGAGIDTIISDAGIDATATSTATAVSVGLIVSVTADGDATSGAAISDASSLTRSAATGIDGGEGDDDVDNSGALDVRASSDATGVAVSLSVAGTAKGDAAGGAVSDASVVAESTATGIDGGGGNDTIYNEGEIRLMDDEEETSESEADASATAVAVSLNVSGSLDGDVSGSALSDTSSTAIAAGTGIAGDTGVDSIDNVGGIVADVSADSTAVAVALDVNVTLDGDATGAALSDSSTNSQALATGIDGGEDGDDIDNLANLDIHTKASSTSVSVTVGIAGSMQGTASSAAIAKTSATSIAESIGIAGGGGADAIDTTGATFGDETTDATVNANDHSIYSHAASEAFAESVTVTATGSLGAASGSAVADASANATAFAAGIDGGSGADTILNASKIDAITNTNAEANATSVTVTLGVGETDSVGVADSSATATSTAIGIGGGDGDDTIDNSADIFAGRTLDVTMAEAIAGSTTVNVSATLGESSGAASANATALADASATGIFGGEGDDTITNEGTIAVGTAVERGEDIDAQAIAHASTQTVDIGVTIGKAFSNASSDSSAAAVSDITGLAGGDGIDILTNTSTGTIDASSSAFAKSASGTTSVGLGLGASERTANANAAAQATAIGTGIEGGRDGDTITTEGDVYVAAQSEALAQGSALSLSIISIGSNEQSAVANGSSTGDALARGVFGDAGDDTITASGTIDVRSDTSVTSNARASSVAGFSVGATRQQAQSSADTTARSLAIGIDGGTGSDTFSDNAVIDVDSVAYASATGVSATNSGFNLAGVSSGESMSDARTTVDATGVGIRGGESELIEGEPDDDIITVANSMTVDVTAEGTSDSTADTTVDAVFGSAQGRALSDASAIVTATGAGIEGGAGLDFITTTKEVQDDEEDTSGNITVTATASADVTSTSIVYGDVDFGSASTMGASDASVDMLSEALGIDAGSGADTLTIDSAIDVDAISSGAVTSTSNANANTTFGSASSGAMSDASAMRRAKASGIIGGEGGDTITTSSDAQISVSALSSGVVKSSSIATARSSFFGDASSTTASAASSQGIAETTGIAGGDGDDSITNGGRLVTSSDLSLFVESESKAEATAGIFGDSYAGAASDTSVAGRALSTGITGDDGINTIETEGVLNVNARSRTTVTNMTVAIAQSGTVASSRNAASSEVVAMGIKGGERVDAILTRGQVAVAGESNISVTALTVSSKGDASSDARTLATANVSGISSGGGDDVITSNADVLVAAAPKVRASKRTFGKGGKVDGNVGIVLRGQVSGIDAGEGDDIVSNNGSLVVIVGRQSDSDAVIGTDTKTEQLVLVDATLVEQDAEEFVGKWLRIDLEDGEVMFTIIEAFDPVNGAITTRDPLPTELVGNVNYTLFDVDDAGADIAASTVDVGGRVSVNAATEGIVVATGVSGGDGGDTITNNGDLGVRASNQTLAASKISAGSVNVDLNTRSDVRVIGIDGDPIDADIVGGVDTISNVGNLDVAAVSSTDFSKVKEFSFGRQDISMAGEAGAWAAGMHGGAMGDTLDNTGDLSVSSLASILARNAALSIVGDIQLQLDFAADSVATGIIAGDGDDTLSSVGSVDVSAISQASVVGYSRTVFNLLPWFGVSKGRSTNVVDATLQSIGRGLDVGDGADIVTNSGLLSVRSAAIPVSGYVAQANAGLNDGGASATAINTSIAYGVVGSGNLDVGNSGVIDVTAQSVSATFAQATEVLVADDQSKVTELSGNDFEFADSALIESDANFVGKQVRFLDSGIEFERSDEATVSTVNSDVTTREFTDTSAIGFDFTQIEGTRIRFENADEYIGEVESFDPDTGVFTLADLLPMDDAGVLLVAAEDGYELSVLTAEVTGFDATTGTFELDEVVPNNALNKAYTFSLASSNDTLSPVSFTFADASRQLEDPEDFIGNWVTFRNEPGFVARVESFSSDDGRFVLTCVESVENCEATSYDVMAGDIYELSLTRGGTSGSDAFANAYGIDHRGGNAVITNSGEILVAATADALTNVNVRFGSGNASANATAVAYGVRTGDGNDIVTNTATGTIDVAAESVTETTTGEQSIQTVAVGIETGSGDDTVTNLGNISAMVTENGVSAEDTAIDLGPGDDQLLLGADSVTVGSVSLGPGDDELILTGNPLITNIDGNPLDPFGGDGIDTLSLIDSGSFVSVPVGFEQAIKTGAGSFALTTLPTMQYLRVEDGELMIDSDYVFAPDSLYETVFYTDGHNGQLLVDGLAELGGAIDVARSGDEYIADATRYDLITATGAANNTFAEMTLPEAMPLLHFELQQGPANLDLVAVAAPFDSVAENPLQQRIASNLDKIAGGASGTFAQTLGHLQMLPDGFGRALQSFSPDIHQVANEGATQVMQQGTTILQSHLRTTRTRYRDGGNAPQPIGQLAMFYSSAGYGGVTMTQAASAAVAGGNGPRQTRSQSWALGMASRGDYDAVSGYTGFEQDTDAFAVGYDFNVNDRLVLGLSVGAADTTIEMFDAYGTGSVDGWSANAYGTWFTSAGYLEWGVGYGEHDINASRAIELGTDVRRASSDHDGDALSLFLGGGKAFTFDRWFVEPFAAVRYFRLGEDAFEESGAGDMSQMIASRDTTALFGDIGVNVGQRVELQSGNTVFDWNLMAGINHDFDIDDRLIDYAYVGRPTERLSLAGRDTADTSVLLGGTLAWYGERLGINLEYRGRFNSDYDEQAIAAIFLLQF